LIASPYLNAFLGGIEVFGFWGIFLGPVVLSLAITFFSMLLDEWRTQRPLDPERAPPLVRERR
jgi:predicted PurR-regulated permease PerM